MTVADPELTALVRQQVEEILTLRGGSLFTRDNADQLETLQTQVGSLLAGVGGMQQGPQWLSGISIVNGTVTADKITVNDLSALNIATGVLNVTGSLTLSAVFPAVSSRIVMDLTGISMYSSAGVTANKRSYFNIDGSGWVGASAGTAATAALSWDTAGANVTIGNTLTIASGGKIIDADGSTWNQSGLLLVSTGTYGDTIKWQVAGVDKGAISASSTQLGIQYGAAAGGSVLLTSTTAELGFDGFGYSTLFPGLFLSSATGFAEIQSGNANQRSRFGTSGNFSAYNRIYPGAAGLQSTGYFDWSGSVGRWTGSDFYFSALVRGTVLEVTTTLHYANIGTGATGALPNPTKWLQFGDYPFTTNYYIPVFTNFNAWTA